MFRKTDNPDRDAQLFCYGAAGVLVLALCGVWKVGEILWATARFLHSL